jgi:hypothetical protein
MSSGTGLFKRPSASSPASPVTSHQAVSSSSTTTLTTTEEISEARNRHGSMSSALGIMRREASPPTSSVNSRMNLNLNPQTPRKLSEGVHRASALSLKRKPLPKEPSPDNPSSSQEDSDLNGKLGKMELGSTMVFLPPCQILTCRLSVSVCAVTRTCGFPLLSLVIGVLYASVLMTSSRISHGQDSSPSQ